MNVLILEDNPISSKVLQHPLEKYGDGRVELCLRTHPGRESMQNVQEVESLQPPAIQQPDRTMRQTGMDNTRRFPKIRKGQVEVLEEYVIHPSDEVYRPTRR